jgi:phosphoribosylformimino-5-aminoimidazole carboxamide ribotide isomerase
MRLIPVIDLKGGRAVHARGGNRAHYEPVHSVLATSSGEALEIATGYYEVLGLRHLYVADLDAITGEGVQRPMLSSLAEIGSGIWLDAGIRCERDLSSVPHAIAHVVVGSETIASIEELRSLVANQGARIIFSLDLRMGAIVSGSPEIARLEPSELVAAVADAGVRQMIILEMDRIGNGRGPQLDRAQLFRDAFPYLEVFVGGGVRGPADLARLATAGCAGVLLATALHEGRVTREHVTAVSS